jgi:hypothetical protein
VQSATSLDELYTVRDDVVNATRDVASQYEDSEMYDRNPDLQERAEMLDSAASELEGWEPDDEEPAEGDEEYEEWLLSARESLQTAIDQMELP